METERITIESSRLCRACGAERLHMFPLFTRDPDDGLRLDNMLMACTDLKIHVSDGLPSWICYSCADELKTSYRFKQQCETTDRYFNELGLKSNEIKQEQETVVFKEREKENLLELKEEMDTTDNANSLSLIEVTEGISESVVISREIKQEQRDLLTITETIVYKQEENFSEVKEDEAIHVGNLKDSLPNEDSPFVHFPNKTENRNIISKETENDFPLGSKEQKEEASNDNDSNNFTKEKLRKTNQFERFECNICGKSYSTSKILRKHKLRHENGGQENFKCEVCAKLFSTNSYLREHKKTHENGKQKYHECNVCGKSYSTFGYLWDHKLTHENDGRKRFECDVCGKSYSMVGYLRDHKLTHENGGRKCFKCEVCGKLFSMRRSLQYHKLRHENGGRKSFECDVCEKSFAASRYLRQHEKTHKNNVLYGRK